MAYFNCDSEYIVNTIGTIATVGSRSYSKTYPIPCVGVFAIFSDYKGPICFGKNINAVTFTNYGAYVQYTGDDERFTGWYIDGTMPMPNSNTHSTRLIEIDARNIGYTYTQLVNNTNGCRDDFIDYIVEQSNLTIPEVIESDKLTFTANIYVNDTLMASNIDFYIPLANNVNDISSTGNLISNGVKQTLLDNFEALYPELDLMTLVQGYADNFILYTNDAIDTFNCLSYPTGSTDHTIKVEDVVSGWYFLFNVGGNHQVIYVYDNNGTYQGGYQFSNLYGLVTLGAYNNNGYYESRAYGIRNAIYVIGQAPPTTLILYAKAPNDPFIDGLLNNLNVSATPTNFTTVVVTPQNSATYTVSTEDNIDTVTVTVADGYVFSSGALYDPTDRLDQRWKALNENNQLIIRRTQAGEWTLRLTMQEVINPYDPDTPIEDLPTDVISATYPSDYIARYIGAGFYKLFVPTMAQLNAFVNYLYDPDFLTNIKNLWNKALNMEELIVGGNIMPCAPTVAGTAIPRVGWLSMTSTQAMNYTNQQYVTVELGSLTVSRAWSNYLDFAPYTKVSIYLPFIGERQLDTNDVMGKSLSLSYNIDLLSGNCVAYVKVNGSIHYQFTGNCAYTIPISQTNASNIALQPLKAIAGLALAGAGVASGNPVLISAGASLGATIESEEKGGGVTTPMPELTSPDVKKIDGLNANTGYMGVVRPYLIVERVKPDINSGFGQTIGYQSNKFRRLGDLTGYTKVQEVHLENIPATAEEIAKIEAILKGGVII